MYAATKNTTVMDYVIDHDFPYADEILDAMEKGSWDDVVAKYNDVKSSLLNMEQESSKKFESFTSKLEQKTEELVEETRKKFDATKSKIDHDGHHNGITPEQQLQRPVEIEVKSHPVKRLPLLSISHDIDPAIKSTVQAFNDVISKIDASDIDAKLVKKINENVAVLAGKLHGLSTDFDAQVETKLKSAHTDLLASYTKKELELTENLLHQFTEEKAQLQTKMNHTLAQEIDATKQAISQAAANAVSMITIEQTNQFEKLVSDKIDTERNGRLNNLKAVVDRLETMEKFAESLHQQVTQNHHKLQIHKSVTRLKTLLFKYPENEAPKGLTPSINELIQLSNETGDELVEEALKNLVPLISHESTHSILSNEQLLARWEMLVPELRSASLLPPNAGLLGHLSSSIFSKLLMPVKGVKPQGKDIESVIGRVEASLIKGQLDDAVEEVSNLKGWPRKLADDWVKEGRKKVEIEFLVDLIDAETRVL